MWPSDLGLCKNIWSGIKLGDSKVILLVVKYPLLGLCPVAHSVVTLPNSVCAIIQIFKCCSGWQTPVSTHSINPSSFAISWLYFLSYSPVGRLHSVGTFMGPRVRTGPMFAHLSVMVCLAEVVGGLNPVSDFVDALGWTMVVSEYFVKDSGERAGGHLSRGGGVVRLVCSFVSSSNSTPGRDSCMKVFLTLLPLSSSSFFHTFPPEFPVPLSLLEDVVDSKGGDSCSFFLAGLDTVRIFILIVLVSKLAFMTLSGSPPFSPPPQASPSSRPPRLPWQTSPGSS